MAKLQQAHLKDLKIFQNETFWRKILIADIIFEVEGQSFSKKIDITRTIYSTVKVWYNLQQNTF